MTEPGTGVPAGAPRVDLTLAFPFIGLGLSTAFGAHSFSGENEAPDHIPEHGSLD